MNKYLVSIIVPIFDSVPFLERCITNLVNQTYSDVEILLVDDGSTDNSLEVCKKYETIDKRIKVFHKNNGGPSSARNLALDNCTGDYIVFCDSDDTLDTTFIEKCISIVNGNENIQLVRVSYRKIKNGITLKPWVFGDYAYSLENQKEKELFLVDLVETYKIGYEVTFGLYSSEVIKKNNIRFDDNISFAEDLLFNLIYISKINNIKSISDCLYNYYINPTSITNSTRKKPKINEMNYVSFILRSNYDNKYSELTLLSLHYFLITNQLKAYLFTKLSYFLPAIPSIIGIKGKRYFKKYSRNYTKLSRTKLTSHNLINGDYSRYIFLRYGFLLSIIWIVISDFVRTIRKVKRLTKKISN